MWCDWLHSAEEKSEMQGDLINQSRLFNSKASLSQISESILQNTSIGRMKQKVFDRGKKKSLALRRQATWGGGMALSEIVFILGHHLGQAPGALFLKFKAIPGGTSVQSCVDFRFYPFLWFFFFQFWLSMQTTFTQAVDHLLQGMFICILFLFITSLGETIIFLKWFVCF